MASYYFTSFIDRHIILAWPRDDIFGGTPNANGDGNTTREIDCGIQYSNRINIFRGLIWAWKLDEIETGRFGMKAIVVMWCLFFSLFIFRYNISWYIFSMLVCLFFFFCFLSDGVLLNLSLFHACGDQRFRGIFAHYQLQFIVGGFFSFFFLFYFFKCGRSKRKYPGRSQSRHSAAFLQIIHILNII